MSSEDLEFNISITGNSNDSNLILGSNSAIINDNNSLKNDSLENDSSEIYKKLANKVYEIDIPDNWKTTLKTAFGGGIPWGNDPGGTISREVWEYNAQVGFKIMPEVMGSYNPSLLDNGFGGNVEKNLIFVFNEDGKKVIVIAESPKNTPDNEILSKGLIPWFWDFDVTLDLEKNLLYFTWENTDYSRGGNGDTVHMSIILAILGGLTINPRTGESLKWGDLGAAVCGGFKFTFSLSNFENKLNFIDFEFKFPGDEYQPEWAKTTSVFTLPNRPDIKIYPLLNPNVDNTNWMRDWSAFGAFNTGFIKSSINLKYDDVKVAMISPDKLLPYPENGDYSKYA